MFTDKKKCVKEKSPKANMPLTGDDSSQAIHVHIRHKKQNNKAKET